MLNWLRKKNEEIKPKYVRHPNGSLIRLTRNMWGDDVNTEVGVLLKIGDIGLIVSNPDVDEESKWYCCLIREHIVELYDNEFELIKVNEAK